jgi:glucose/arabinose dehydrogenase
MCLVQVLQVANPMKNIIAVLTIYWLLSQSLMAQDLQLEFTQVSDLFGIVDITNAGDGSDRLFLVEQAGRIYILKDGQTLPEPFLDIRDRVTGGGERGLLSLAFAPDFKSSGNFYVFYTQSGGDTVLSRFGVSANPDIANINNEKKLLTVEQPYSNHNGGRLQFGPDGMLYLGFGDGGSSNDPGQRAQDGSTLLGKLIRIDVDPVNVSYAIPADNPFLENAGVRDEIWALGLRNPWKISFDPKTGDLYIADVGQSALEEVNFQAVTSSGGENYGWDIMEGSQCTDGNCDQSGMTLPVSEYTHDDGCSITGGEVYRGQSYPNLKGRYLFGDYCSGKIWSLHKDGADWVTTLLTDTNFDITTFGLAEDRSMFVANSSGGIYLISDGDVKPEILVLNPGFNDAWYNPDTSGQGFFITVFPVLELVSVAWFTYDTELPPDDATANLGDPGHRWITAAGQYVEHQAVMNITLTSGGIFDTPSVIKRTDPPGSDGTLTLNFEDCSSGTVEYDISSINRTGIVPIQRVADDNDALCEALSALAQ